METDQKNTVIFDEVETVPEERNWMSRTFGKMEKDSLRGTIFLMMAGTLGAGVYALHGTFAEIGIFWAIMLLVIGCVSSLLALDMYIHASRVAGDPDSFSEINTKIVGSKFNHLASGVSIFFLYVVMISFMICISQLAIKLIFKPPAPANPPTPEDIALAAKLMPYHRFFCFVIALLSIGFIIPKSADLISRFAIPCFLIHIYVILVIICQTFSFYKAVKAEGNDNYNYFNMDAKSGKTIIGFFKNFGLAICTFNNVPNFMMVRTIVASPSTRRLRKIFNRSNWIIMGIYIITALCGYISVGHIENIPNMIIFRESKFTNDFAMDVAKFLLALSLIVSFSLLGFATKMMVIPYLPGSDSFKHVGFSLALVFSVFAIAMNFTQVSNYINFAGSFGGTFIVIIIPAILALYSGYSKNKAINIGIKAWLVLGAISGAISTALAVLKIAGKGSWFE